MRKVKYPEIGNRIRQLRIDAGLKQKDCLEPLGDVTAQMLSDWENGYVFPSLTYLINISTFYKASLDYIILGKQKDKNDKTIRTYKDVAECMISLTNGNLFTIDDYTHDGVAITHLNTYDKTIHRFKEEFDLLFQARNSMKRELYDEAIADLVNRYDIPIEPRKQKPSK